MLRLAKFFTLVQNEYIKVLKRLSTKIMLILIILAGIAMPVFAMIVKNINSSYIPDMQEYSIQQFYSKIEYAKSSKGDGWENDVEKYQYLIDKKISFDTWQFEAVEQMYSDEMTLAVSGNPFSGVDLSQYEDVAASMGVNINQIAQSFGMSANPDENVTLSTELAEKIKGMLKDSVESNDYYKFLDAKLECLTALNSSAPAEQLEVLSWEYKYRKENKLVYGENQALDSLIGDISTAKQQVYSYDHMDELPPDVSEADVDAMRDNILVSEYQLENKTYINLATTKAWYYGDFSFWPVFMSTVKLLMVVGILIIVVSGSIVASEFSEGTVKFLLVNPAKRWKIMLSKYFTAVTIGYIMILLLYGVSLIVSLITFGSSYETAAYVSINNGVIESVSPYLHVFKTYMLSGIEVAVMASLAFAISTLVRSSALSIGIGMFTYLIGNTINSIVSLLGFSWAIYLLFANTIIATIAEGASPYFGHTVSFALCILAVHMIVFALTAWDGFVRREI